MRSTRSSTSPTPASCRQWAWVEEPLRYHPLDRPFAWALIQIDGADTSMLHALDAGSADRVVSGMRVPGPLAGRAPRPPHRHRVLRAGGERRDARPPSRTTRTRRSGSCSRSSRSTTWCGPARSTATSVGSCATGRSSATSARPAGSSTCRRGGSARSAWSRRPRPTRSRSATRASSRRGRCSHRSSTTARPSGRTTRSRASCSTEPTARSVSSASSTSSSTRSAWACAWRRCGPTRPRPRAATHAGYGFGNAIQGFRATGEPDAPARGLREAHAVRDVAIVSFAQSGARVDVEETETQLLFPVITEAIERSGIPRKEIGFTCSGSADYLAGAPFAFVGNLEATGAWPPISESHVEMDGRVGALRGVGPPPARRRRRRARVLLGHLVAREPPRGAVPAERPLLPHAALGGSRVAGGAAGAGVPRRHRRQGVRPGGGRVPEPPQRPRQPERARVRRPEPRRAPRRAVRGLPAARERLPAGHRRGGGRRARRRRSRPRGERPAGVDPRHRPPHRPALHRACAT